MGEWKPAACHLIALCQIYGCPDLLDSQRSAEDLESMGLVEKSSDTRPLYRVTEKGGAWLQMLLDTPLPEQRWVDPRRV